MPAPMPGQTESSYLGFAVVSALMDTLVAKGAITAAERTAIYRAAMQSLRHDGEMFKTRAAQFIADGLL